MDDSERTAQRAQLEGVIAVIAPLVEADGGQLTVVNADVETGEVTVQLSGACSSCAIAGATLHDGVERIIVDRVPWVTRVVGVVAEDDIITVGRGGYIPMSEQSVSLPRR